MVDEDPHGSARALGIGMLLALAVVLGIVAGFAWVAYAGMTPILTSVDQRVIARVQTGAWIDELDAPGGYQIVTPDGATFDCQLPSGTAWTRFMRR